MSKFIHNEQARECGKEKPPKRIIRKEPILIWVTLDIDIIKYLLLYNCVLCGQTVQLHNHWLYCSSNMKAFACLAHVVAHCHLKCLCIFTFFLISQV